MPGLQAQELRTDYENLSLGNLIGVVIAGTDFFFEVTYISLPLRNGCVRLKDEHGADHYVYYKDRDNLVPFRLVKDTVVSEQPNKEETSPVFLKGNSS